MKDILDILFHSFFIVCGSILFGYMAIVKPMKETLERDRKIDKEPVPDGIVAKEH